MHSQREIKDMKSLSMRRGISCDLDLRLSSPFANYYYDLLSSADTTTSSPVDACTNNSMKGERGGGGGSSSGSAGSGSQQPLTIIFNGKVCVSDVTELQARAILCHAATGRSELMDHESRLMINTTTSPATTTTTPCSSSLPPPSPSLLLQSATSTTPTTTTTTTTTAMNVNEISMKKSLQRFLQKRKNRIQSFPSHPYNRQ